MNNFTNPYNLQPSSTKYTSKISTLCLLARDDYILLITSINIKKDESSFSHYSSLQTFRIPQEIDRK